MFLRHPFHMFHLQPGPSNCLFPIGTPTKPFHACLICSTSFKCPVHSILFNSTILICGEECIIWRSSWCNFLNHPVASTSQCFSRHSVLLAFSVWNKWIPKLLQDAKSRTEAVGCITKLLSYPSCGVQQQQQQPNSSVEHKTRARPSVTEHYELQWKGLVTSC